MLGREAERARVESAFARGERLVALVGVGGVGKTLLARSIAEDRPVPGDDAFDASSWCGVGAVTTDELVMAVALASGVRLGEGEPPREALGRALSARGARLLVLDECERSLPAVEALVPTLLSHAPALQILVTSRVRAALPIGVVVELAPLPVPTADGAEPEEIARSPAVQVLLDRARRAGAPAALLEGEIAALGALARRVGGLPLALELCAARLITLSPGQLLERLARGTLDLSDRGRGARHESLEAVIRTSWELLDGDEQLALAQCSVFAESFSLESAEAVLDLPEGADVLGCLERLRANSMIDMRVPGPRFALLEAVRELASARLAASGDAGRIEGRHAAHYAALADALRGGAGDPRLAAEIPNLRAVVQRGGSPVAARRAALAAASVLWPRGAFGALAEILEAALSAPTSEPVATLDVEILVTLGRVEIARGARTAAIGRFDAAVTRAEGPARPGALVWRADALSRLGRFDEARRDLDEAEAMGAPAELLRDLSRSRAILAWHAGTLDDNRRDALRALAAAQASGDAERICVSRLLLAMNLSVAGAPLAAEACLEQVQREAEGAGLDALAVPVAHYRAIVELDQGLTDRAEASFRRAAELAARAGRHEIVAWSRLYGAAAARLSRPDSDVTAELDAARAALASAGPLAAAAVHLAAFAGSEVASQMLDDGAGGNAVAAAAFRDEVRARRALAEARRRALTDASGARAALAEARAAVAAAREVSTTAPPGYAFDVRLGARLLAADADAIERTLLQAGDPGPPPLLIGPEARWFRVGDGPPVSLERAPALRRLLDTLAEARLATPDRPLSVWDLWQAVWPGDRSDAASVPNRVYVTLNRLRRLQLLAHVVRRDDGWLLDPRAPVARAATSPRGR
jgi:predicted ATPase